MIHDMHYATDLYAIVVMTLAVASVIVAYFTKLVQITIQMGFKYAILLSVVMLGFGFVLLMF